LRQILFRANERCTLGRYRSSILTAGPFTLPLPFGPSALAATDHAGVGSGV
jgi:hypothetical protein